ncbi:MAG: hypothetical protein EAZ76_05785 [Nostocales cyanobacterium]|nr:MAG: hypothetical protein EAZ87_12420 [Nostocales cyanobacterium]TAF17638.1 MAG: hypothetical protein EAZ76_05785 [Nostocales cyanobacterium]
MNTISNLQIKRSTWQTAVILTLGFWLSSSMLLDWVIMPSLYFSGMMNESGFAAAGYTIFWNFNRLELLLAAIAFTSVMAMSKTRSNWRLDNIFLSCLLLTVALLDTYLLAPQMCALGSNLTLFTANAIDKTMSLLHSSYFILETLKLLAAGVLLHHCWQQSDMKNEYSQ